MKRFPASMRWRVALVLAIVLAAGLGHAPLLRLLVRPLRSEQSIAGARYLVLQGDERGVHDSYNFTAAAQFYQADTTRQILLLEWRPGRVVELGLLRSFAALGRQELARMGVPDAAVEVIDGQAADPWEVARRLGISLRAMKSRLPSMKCGGEGSQRLASMTICKSPSRG